MSRTWDDHWAITVPTAGGVPRVLRMRVEGEHLNMDLGSGRTILLDVRQLAELVVDLKAAGRVLRAADAGRYIAGVGREQYGPPEKWAPISDEIDDQETDR